MFDGCPRLRHVLNGGRQRMRKIPGLSVKLKNDLSFHDSKKCVVTIRLKEAICEIRSIGIKSRRDYREFIFFHALPSDGLANFCLIS